MTKIALHNRFKNWFALGIIWLVGAICDRLWFTLDRNVPAWDQADYLTGSLNYLQALQNPQWFDGEWWIGFWQLSSKVPPLTYIIAAIIQNIFGTGADRATIVHLLFSAILLISVYGLGERLFDRRVGLWAAGICVLLPGLYRYRLDFLLDYPLTAVITLTFYCLTLWKLKDLKKSPLSTDNASATKKDLKKSPLSTDNASVTSVTKSVANRPLRINQWLLAFAFGICLGLALMVKQTVILFILTPILVVLAATIFRREWERLGQLVGSLFLAIIVFFPWVRTNWLLMLTAGKRATLDSAIAEGDPALNTLDAWIYYWKILLYLISWPLLLVPIVAIILYWGKRLINQQLAANFATDADKFPDSSNKLSPPTNNSSVKSVTKSAASRDSSKWLTIFLVGGYLLCSVNINKDARYILPLLPVFSLFLAYGITLLPRRWGTYIRWATVSLASLLMLLNLFPIGGAWLTQLLSPRVQNYAYLGTQWPHQEVINEIIQTEPYLRSTLGVLPSTPAINQHNFNYYGALANFQVYGRQVGTRKSFVPQDARSLSWFLTKTGDPGSVPSEAQSTIVQLVEQTSDFQLHKTWNLPDRSTLKLYHSRTPPIQVQPLAKSTTKIKLNKIIVPDRAPPGVPVSIIYDWSGSWQQLQSGLVLLTWNNSKVPLKLQTNKHRWLHDHAIGMGNLYPKILTAKQSASGFRVVERMAMLPPANIVPGIYTLKATYLNPQTGENYPISVPPVSLKIDRTAAATVAPELDLLTQLRTVAIDLPKGTKALEPVFDRMARINQYDPTQDYLNRASQALTYRLKQEPQNLEWAYALALSQVLQQRVEGAIAALKQVIRLDSQNPYAYAYLAFVNLYDWRPKAAQTVLKSALALNPNLPELQALSGAAALMQGNLIEAWHYLQPLTLK